MMSDFFKRLFSRIPRRTDGTAEKKRAELAKCRFFVDAIRHLDDGAIGLQGLVGRGRVYVGEPLELVGYGERATIHCHTIWKGRSPQDCAWKQTHLDPFLLVVRHDAPEIFRAGQVLAAVGTVADVRRCGVTLEVTGTPGNLGRPLSEGFEGTLHFRTAQVTASVTFSDGGARALPGETVEVVVGVSEPLPLEAGDEIRLSSLGHVFARGPVTGVGDS